MPSKAHVLIHYGPYEALGIVDHRLSRLEGLEAMMTSNNHTVEKVPIPDWNVVEVWVNGAKVFDCDIRDLDFGSDGQLDKLCNDARDAVKHAY